MREKSKAKNKKVKANISLVLTKTPCVFFEKSTKSETKVDKDDGFFEIADSREYVDNGDSAETLHFPAAKKDLAERKLLAVLTEKDESISKKKTAYMFHCGGTFGQHLWTSNAMKHSDPKSSLIDDQVSPIP